MSKARKSAYLSGLFHKKPARKKAGLHKTVSASKSIFLSNTAKKRYGRRQPYHSVSSCLGRKILAFEVRCSFVPWIFFL